jgi:hypothetical protein
VSGWTDFAVVTGAATAALLGLLFVAVSIRVEAVARSSEVANRSAQTMALLLTGLLTSVLLAVPGQSNRELGAELLALGVSAAGVAFVLDRRAGHRDNDPFARWLHEINPTHATCALLVVAGVVLTLGHGRGLYLLVLALIAVLVGGVVNAWLILVRLAD